MISKLPDFLYKFFCPLPSFCFSNCSSCAVANWCLHIRLWIPSSDEQFQVAPVKSPEGILVPISTIAIVIKGLRALEDLSAFSYQLGLVAGLPAVTQVGGCMSNSINTGICVCKSIFNPLPTRHGLCTVIQRWTILRWTHSITSSCRRIVRHTTLLPSYFWCHNMFAGPGYINQERRPQRLLPSANPSCWHCPSRGPTLAH